MSGTFHTPRDSKKPLKVAIIGGGPGGLAAAIELSKLDFVRWELYEKRPQISEIGGGLTLQPRTWRRLECNGTASNISPDDHFRPPDRLIEQKRYAPRIRPTILGR